MEWSDAELIRASVKEPEQFATLFDRHHDRICAYIARRAGALLADELAGEVFLRAFASRMAYDPGRGSPLAWLYGIAGNLVRMSHRSQQRGARAAAQAAGQMASTPSDIDMAEDGLVGRQSLAAALDAFELLSEAHQEVLALAVWEGLSYQEIASCLEVDIGTVRSRLARARQHLRELCGLTGKVTGDDGKRSARG